MPSPRVWARLSELFIMNRMDQRDRMAFPRLGNIRLWSCLYIFSGSAHLPYCQLAYGQVHVSRIWVLPTTGYEILEADTPLGAVLANTLSTALWNTLSQSVQPSRWGSSPTETDSSYRLLSASKWWGHFSWSNGHFPTDGAPEQR